MWKVHNATIFEGEEYHILSMKGFAKLTPKAGSFLHIPSPT